jgi:hypothetical protein
MKVIVVSQACRFCIWKGWTCCYHTISHTLNSWGTACVQCGEFFITLCCAYSLQMYKLPVDDGRQKHCDQKELMINPLHFPAVSMCCIIQWWDVGEFYPGLALLVGVDLTTHTCEVLSSSFERTDSPGMPKAVWVTVDTHTYWGELPPFQALHKHSDSLRCHKIDTWKTWFTHRHFILNRIYCLYHWDSTNCQAENWCIWAHMTVSAASLSALYWGWWLNVWILHWNGNKYNYFRIFQCCLDFQT